MAAGVRGSHQEHSDSPLGVASGRSERRVSSGIRAFILPKIGAARARARNEVFGKAVANGQDAGLAWERLVGGRLDGDERARIRKALLNYCGQDTLAPVRLVEMLRARVH